ncbi:hypothetical protein T02_15290 [Trichinella nativa]|uniref:Uncharacterized protein n=1 Tax=Trichinella nativa TaxID=6335 RepID=A0A0V1LWG7_9BILA|nr:hypothetical protein T02_15290 [Trichinella nativa]
MKGLQFNGSNTQNHKHKRTVAHNASRDGSTIISVISTVGIGIHEDALNGSPMCLSRVIRKTTDNPHCLANVWLTTLTQINQASDGFSVRYSVHPLCFAITPQHHGIR